MDTLFLKIINMSIAASWLILAVLLLRVVLKKAPRWISVLLWGIVAIRLICPITLESGLSLVPTSETIPIGIGTTQEPVIHSGLPVLNTVVNPILSQSGIPVPGASANPLQIWIGIFSCVWLFGLAVMLLYAAASFFRLHRKVGASLSLKDRIWICDEIQTPFILGVFRPRIYIPSGTEEHQLPHIIAHENAHLQRRDHWWKPLGYLVLSVHWFNPLVWAAYILLCRDIELACDEKVIRNLGKEGSIAYSEALLNCSVGRRTIMVCPLAFGEVGVKERVKHVLNYQKPAFWIVLAAVAASVVLSVCFLTNPKGPREFPMTGRNLSDLNTDQILSGICEAEGLDDGSKLNFNADNFDLMVTSGFDLDNAGAIRFSYVEHQKTYSSQLQMFHKRDQYFVTDRSEWSEQVQIYKLGDYLNALRYLPQEEIRKLSPDADRYLIVLRPEGAPANYSRVVTYDKDGHCAIDGWQIHLEIQPLQNGHGTGADVIHAFYADSAGSNQLHSAQNDLDSAISSALADHYAPNKPNGLIHIESYQILFQQELYGVPEEGEEPDQEKVTVYLLVLHQSFQPDSDPTQPIEEVGGDYIPTALTFRLIGDDYLLEEYWEPRSGGYYTDDIKLKFPEEAQQQVWEDREIIQALKQANQEKILSILERQGIFDQLADRLLDEVCRSSNLSSNPHAYIQNAQEQYEELLGYGEATLRYCLRRFLEGSQTDLKGHIMAELCRDLMETQFGMTTEDGRYETGQDWFDAFYASSVEIAENVSLEDLEKYHPVSKLLLDLAEEDHQKNQIVNQFRLTGVDQMESAELILYNDGTFQFFFSPYSSYIGRGTYEAEQERLKLCTDDGLFTYLFDLVEGNLVYDEFASQGFHWYSGLKNGAVMEPVQQELQ